MRSRSSALAQAPSVDAQQPENYSPKMDRRSASVSRLPASDARTVFLERLRGWLREKSYLLVSGEFGREAQRGVWILTVQLPNEHVRTVRAPVAPKDDPFAPEVCDDIARRVIAFLAK